MKRKDALIFSNRLLHSSYPQKTKNERIAIAYRYTINNQLCIDKQVDLIKKMYHGDAVSYFNEIGLEEGFSLALDLINPESSDSLKFIRERLQSNPLLYCKFHHT
ncbi:MAG: hypothetical protein QNJ74_20525 [Trichodesmium sp. MO_231.B1]|nr:hypothetical protein [Trichodesmium sp. MO_231.B1]